MTTTPSIAERLAAQAAQASQATQASQAAEVSQAPDTAPSTDALEVQAQLSSEEAGALAEEIVSPQDLGGPIVETMGHYKNRMSRLVLADGTKIELIGGILFEKTIAHLTAEQRKEVSDQVAYYKRIGVFK